MAAIVLVLLGFLVILFAGGSPIIWLGMLLVLAGGGIGTKLGLDLWRATE